jgi:hypothetical protein
MRDGGRASMSWAVRTEEHKLVAAFSGYLSEEEGQQSAAEFVKQLGAAPRDIVFDISEMSGYAMGARRAWQGALWPLRAQLRSLSVIGGNAIVRMGATMIALALGVPASFDDKRASP